MNPYLHAKKFSFKGLGLVVVLVFLLVGEVAGQTTFYWRGGGTTDWNLPSNWHTKDTQGNFVVASTLPGPNDKVIVAVEGASPKQPKIEGNRTFNYNSLEIRDGGKLVVESGKNGTKLKLSIAGGLTVSSRGKFEIEGADLEIGGNLIIESNGSLENRGTDVKVEGDWINNGEYKANVKDSKDPSVTLTGEDKIIAGATTTGFMSLNIQGSVTLNQNVAITIPVGVASTEPAGLLITGTLDMGAYNLNSSNPLAMMNVADEAALRLSGQNNFPSNFQTVTLEPASTVEYYGEGAQTIASHKYGKLSITKKGVKTLAGDNTEVYIKGALELSPATTSVANTATQTLEDEAIVLSTGTNTIVLGPEGSIEESANAYVTGTVEKKVNTVEANSTSTFGGIGINVTPDVTLSNLTITRITGLAAEVGSGKAVKGTGTNVHRLFFLNGGHSDISSVKAEISMKYLSHERNNNSDEELVGYWSDTNEASSWWRTINPVTATAGQITINNDGNLSPWGYFTLGSSVRPLPVELISFTAAKRGTDAVLNWAVASEENNKGFEIEASTDGHTFEEIGFVESKVVNTSIRQDYSFTDSRKGKHGIVYYRLKQVDLDGTTSIFGPRDVNFRAVKTTSIAAHPNPIKDNLVVALASPQAGQAKITVHDMMGKVWLAQNQQVDATSPLQDVNLNVEKFQAGIYILTVELNDQVQTLKLIKR